MAQASGRASSIGVLKPMADRSLDTSGLTCPIPILKAKKALGEMAIGTTLEIVATDPAAPNDFEAFCRATGHVLVHSTQDARGFVFLIQRT
jgi:tRNA 2-thiouridine synthesizing protein A